MLKPETITWLLHRCSIVKALRPGLSLHAAVFKTGMESDVYISNHVLNMYAKCGDISPARKMFDEMSGRNIVSWSALISGYEQAGEYSVALDLFSEMWVVPNEYIYSTAISACANLMALPQGKQIHAQVLKVGYASISFVSNSLVSMYMKCSNCSDALSVHECMPEPNLVSYNALIKGFLENKRPEKGFAVFKLVQLQGLVPDRFSFAGALEICADLDNLLAGMVFHCQAIKHNLDSNDFVGNVIVAMYSKFNLVEEAEKGFRVIEEKNMVSWNTLITACSHCADYAKGLRVFKQMTSEYGLRPDDFTFASVLAASAGLASIQHGKQTHAHLTRTRTCQDVEVGNALVSMYAKCGFIKYAYNVFNKMARHNLVSWNTIIAGFATHGLGERAVEIFEQMRKIGVKPDSITFVGLLMACSHGGLVDWGISIFNSMKKTFGITPDVEHFSCLIDMLGRAGRLSEAEEYMRKSPFKHHPIVLGSLLSACRLHGDVTIGEYVARHLLKLESVSTSCYVLLSSLYASDEMWGDAAKARKMLNGSGLKKEPGHSLVEVNGSFEKFTVGNFSHSRIEEIKYTLRTLCCPVDEVFLDIT
ncbi:Tetratricopeptide-like helical domain containing protein [Parasponia andersonii]|uniref:Tetratricopeptide-like helical domain containing protein n=1 Tax=Parasponia andersonii TaxID=3476 RepID=A0A2P5DLK0_PARAD|nr:Tetratricopeptide-like helical domain containing protein [Parasponia andersonii]